MCKSWCELILGLVIIVFALWQTSFSVWVVLIAGIALVIHSFTCTKCFGHMERARKK